MWLVATLLNGAVLRDVLQVSIMSDRNTDEWGSGKRATVDTR